MHERHKLASTHIQFHELGKTVKTGSICNFTSGRKYGKKREKKEILLVIMTKFNYES